MEKVASLEEIKTSWTLEEVADANDMLDYMAAQQSESAKPKAVVDPEVERMLKGLKT